MSQWKSTKRPVHDSRKKTNTESNMDLTMDLFGDSQFKACVADMRPAVERVTDLRLTY